MTSTNFIGRPGDFEFLVGHWQLNNRCLKRRHIGSDDWDEFTATSKAWSMLNGIVSVDENHFATRGFSGLTFRTLDLSRKQWSIYWVNSASGNLFPPVHGGFDGDRGEFYGEDTDDGVAVQVRFIWTRKGRDAARWEQAFSKDPNARATGEWETNWTMDLSRTEEST
jgi:hypothetical protein